MNIALQSVCKVDNSGRSEITLQREKEIEEMLGDYSQTMKCVYFEGYAFVPVIHIPTSTAIL